VALSALRIQGYRSVRNLNLPVEAGTVFVGANGVGKTNLYKALGLLQRAAAGTITRAIAKEGGIESVLWAGSRKRGEPVGLALRAHFDATEKEIHVGLPHSYEIELGLPSVTDAAFTVEPLVKEERLKVRHGRRDVVLMERKGPLVTLRNEDGVLETHKNSVLPSETALATFRAGARYPMLEAVRRELLDWRLYHSFRTDAASPVRHPCHAITTPTLCQDGRDLAAVLATLFVIRQDTAELANAVDDAFPGAQLNASEKGSSCTFSLNFPDMPRAFGAHELSDGTLRYLCLLGALMGYRLPPLIALNEPEASLHPALLPPLARLIGRAVQNTSVWIVTHSEVLADAIGAETGKPARRVTKADGATSIEGLKMSGEYRTDEAD
jgi:predicted ATPase